MDNLAAQDLKVRWLDITAICPDGTKMHIGKPDYSHPNPIINLVRGAWERARFEHNRKKFNAFVAQYQQEQAHG